MEMLNKWDYSGVADMVFGTFEAYEKPAEFLGDTVEDWGCGTAWAKNYFKNYRGIDGSYHENVDEIVDLQEYTSDVDNILMRQVLEVCGDWRKVLENVKKSFKKKFCLVLYTPFIRKTKVVDSVVSIKADGTRMGDDMVTEVYNFKKKDILDYFPKDEFNVKEEKIGKEWILYVERL